MPHVTISVPARFLAIIDQLAEKNQDSRSSLLGKVFLFGLRDYAELYLTIARLTGDAPVHHDHA